MFLENLARYLFESNKLDLWILLMGLVHNLIFNLNNRVHNIGFNEKSLFVNHLYLESILSTHLIHCIALCKY